jgi:GNAT superfamily N-acetyltransferase
MSDTGSIVVRDYRPEDRDAAIRVLTDGFLGFPPTRIVVGDDDGAAARLYRMNAMMFDPEPRSHVLVAEREGGIGGVLTYADQPDCFSMAPRQMLGMVRIIGPRLIRATRLMWTTMRVHPKTPHRHLLQVAVAPAAQRQGIGGALMTAYCARCDDVGLPGYLETIDWADGSRPSQRRLYERFGFTVANSDPMAAEWAGITMARPKATQSAAASRTIPT